MIGLKPCPFCGCKDIEIERVGTSRASCIVVCTECGCKLESNETGAGRFWNTRIESPELTTLREQVKVLREALALAKGFIKNGLDFGYITPPEPGDPACDILNDICKALDQAKPKNEDPEKLARLIATRVNCFGLLSARKLVSGLGTLDNIINAEPADLDAIFGKGSIKSIHLRKYLSDPANVGHLRPKAQSKPKGGE